MRRTNAADPWRAPVIVAQIPEIGLSWNLEADKPTRDAMAKIAGLREILSARAEFNVKPESDGRVHVAGRLVARIGQTCVVTLDPIENNIDETIDLIFAPPEQIPDRADDADEGPDAADQMEPIENGIIDLGRLATDVLYLAIDPYPRKPGAVFEPRIEAANPEDHPFAALKTLKLDPVKSTPGRPKGK
jgi:uncharacterized metal-binding protein YceD (DUF177 family)